MSDNWAVPDESPNIAAMPRCRDCRWWTPGVVTPNALHMEALSEAAERGWGLCLLTGSRSNEPEHETTAAFVIEGDRYEGALITAPEFGCTQFQAREEPCC